MHAKEPTPHEPALVSRGDTDVIPVLDVLTGNYESEMNRETPAFTK